MSKITIITASPRKDSNSMQLAQWFQEEAERLGAEVVTFDAIKLSLDGCHACNACFRNGHACAFEHGFDPIAEAVISSETTKKNRILFFTNKCAKTNRGMILQFLQ